MAKFDVLKFVDQLEPGLRSAFLSAVYDIQDSAQLEVLVRYIRDGKFSEAVASLGLGSAFFAKYEEEFRRAYFTAGDASMRSFPKPRNRFDGSVVEARFDMRNPAAESWVRTASSRLVTEVLEETKESIRTFLTTSMADGVGPRSAALDIVGRYDRTAGRRVGGIIGLHSRQAQFVQNARSELLSDDPSLMANYLTRKRRDRRFDPVVQTAIREGRAVPRQSADRMVTRYSDSLLQLRGETIARTELMQGLHNAQDQAINQLVDTGQVTREQIKATWDSSEDADTRDSHRAMEGQERGRDGSFTTGDGFKLKYPGDRSLGAPAQEIINCRCRVIIDIDYTRELRPRRG